MIESEHKGREDEPLRRIHIYMFQRDVELIEALYGANLGMSKFIRTVMRDYLDKLRARAEEKRQGEKKLTVEDLEEQTAEVVDETE